MDGLPCLCLPEFSMGRGGVVGGRGQGTARASGGMSHGGTFSRVFGIKGLLGRVRGILTVGGI